MQDERLTGNKSFKKGEVIAEFRGVVTKGVAEGCDVLQCNPVRPGGEAYQIVQTEEGERSLSCWLNGC